MQKVYFYNYELPMLIWEQELVYNFIMAERKIVKLFTYFYEQILVFNYYVDDNDDDDAKNISSSKPMKLFCSLTT